MALGILQHGIVQQHKDGTTTLLRPDKNGGPGREIEVPQELADRHRLATGDVVEGATEPVEMEALNTAYDEERIEAEEDWDTQRDEPSAARGGTLSGWQAAPRVPTERQRTVTRINGLTLEEAEERPFPRARRSQSERTPPDRLLPIATGPNDLTGRILDFAAPLGAGCMGAIWGPHGSGLTRTLHTVLNGILTHAPDCVTMVLLLRARSEEITDWRRRFPQADIVVGSTALRQETPEQTLRLAGLLWEAAARQTELGRDVVLLIDSLTGLWGTLLEAEEADAQAQADQSHARQRVREWVQKAGCFHGETPLGGSLGGSLTILGTVWHQPLDAVAEEEQETHPHLRLLEHLIPDLTWRVVLSAELARQRLYPAVDVKQCLALQEERYLPSEVLESLFAARGVLPRSEPLVCYRRLLTALEATADGDALLQSLLDAE